jgi:epoxyqueuosine reductase QueG
MDKSQTERLRRTIIEMGADLVGFADLIVLPDGIRNGYPRGISVAIRHNPEIIKSIRNGPTFEYALAYEQLNAQLNSLIMQIAAYIEGLGFNAKPLKATVVRATAPGVKEKFKPLEDILIELPHKTIATLAGLGWIGKTDLLVNEKYGPRIRLASILTDLPFACDEPIIESRCGSCTACADACPVKAGRAQDWHRDSPPGEQYDVHQCYEFAKKISIERGFSHQLCGICMAVCPVGRQ